MNSPSSDREPSMPPPFVAGDLAPLPDQRRREGVRLWTLVCLCLFAGAAAFAAYEYYNAAMAAEELAGEQATQKRLLQELAQAEAETLALPMSEPDARGLAAGKQYLLEREQEARKGYKESISAYAAPARQLERKDLLERRDALKKEIEELKKS